MASAPSRAESTVNPSRASTRDTRMRMAASSSTTSARRMAVTAGALRTHVWQYTGKGCATASRTYIRMEGSGIGLSVADAWQLRVAGSARRVMPGVKQQESQHAHLLVHGGANVGL